ncbi:MAG: translation initiation factor IF-2 [Clostridiales bacterium]|nr:translation initiation factor IF-2 [Clostridiales bacterium]
MRVNELAKELGKTSKEILDILQKQNQDVKTHSSSISTEQIGIVKRTLSGAGAVKPAARPVSAGVSASASGAVRPASSIQTGSPTQSSGTARAAATAQAGTGSRPAMSAAPASTASASAAQSSGATGNGTAAGTAPKKKMVAVYRPQNSQQRPQRPQGQSRPQGQQGVRPQAGGIGTAAQGGARPANAGQGSVRPATAAQGSVRPTAPTQGVARPVAPAQESARPAAPTQGTENPAVSVQGSARPETAAQGSTRAASSEMPRSQQPSMNRPQGADRTQGQPYRDNRDRNGQSQGSYGNRSGQGGQGSYGNRGGQSGQGSYGNRSGQSGQGSYGNRSGQGSQGNYGNRSGQSGQGSYGNRSGQGGQGSYGNRSGQGGQGSYGNRGGQGGQGSYGNRNGQGGQGSYGNRGGQSGQGGYGNRNGQGGQGSYGNRSGQSGQGRPGGFGNRTGQGGGFGAGRGGSRPGQRDGGPKSFDTQLQAKPTSNRKSNNNNYKNDRYNKRNSNEDGPRNKGGKVSKHPFIMPQKQSEQKAEETIKVITIPETLTIKELADKMKLQPSAIIKKLFLQGQIVTMNSDIDFEKAEEIAMEYEILCEKEEKVDVIAELLKEEEEDENDMIPRPPVVCVMGHVDHGKTSLLDAIRSTNVTSHEAGGITQHIGAYTVEINGQKITFLDTPGHEAFTAMRMRGAQSTDIAILVVAADDGVMPQTIEAINHAKAAGVEIIVAINKIDKPSANVERVKQELTEYELVPEDWGGSTIFVPVSAHTKEGIPELLEMILLTAEVKELKANPNRRCRGLVIEAELDKGKGPVATILVQKGTLRVGDNVTVGACYGKVRAMMDDKGRRVKEAGPSTPVEVLGLNDVPGAGDVIIAVENEKEARSYAETFIAEGKNRLLEETKSKLSLDDLFSQIKAGNVKELPIIVKADVQGSVEAVKTSLLKLSNEEVVVKVIHGGVGAINESDVSLASASNAIIIGFNVRPDATAKSVAEQEKVDMRLYRVIYQAIEDVEAAMKGMLDPVFEEQVIGHAVVRQTFKASGVGTIAGSYVLDGKLQRGCSCRVSRAGEQLFDGALVSLKRFKDDAKEVAAGYECGLVFDKFNDLQEDDAIEAYMMVEVPR